jgi:hypothetical protein
MANPINAEYDVLNKAQLEKRLKREPTAAELINSDNDSDLVTEIMWELMLSLADRIVALETAAGITPPSI